MRKVDRPSRILSSTRHVEPSVKLRGPSRKAKYSLATDSEPSSASERWEEPLQGEDTEPETTCLQAVRARLLSSGLAIFLTDNETRRWGDKEKPIGFFCLSPCLSVSLSVGQVSSPGLRKGDGVPFA